MKEIVRYKDGKARMRFKVPNVTSSIMNVAITKKYNCSEKNEKSQVCAFCRSTVTKWA